jgi:hypothetical protein
MFSESFLVLVRSVLTPFTLGWIKLTFFATQYVLTISATPFPDGHLQKPLAKLALI